MFTPTEMNQQDIISDVILSIIGSLRHDKFHTRHSTTTETYGWQATREGVDYADTQATAQLTVPRDHTQAMYLILTLV